MTVIHTTTVIDGVEYDYAYSDAGQYVCRDGQQWTEAVDPLNSGRRYTEGDPIPSEERTEDSEILDILLGGGHDQQAAG